MATRPKILYVITKSNFGGAQRYIFDLATNLKGEYDVVVAAGGNGILFEKLAKENIRTVSIPFLGRDIKFWNEPKVFFEFYKLFKREKPQVAHLNSSKVGLVGALAVRVYNIFNPNEKIKSIYTIHGFAFNEPRNILWRSLVWLASYKSLLLNHENIVVSMKDKNDTLRMPFVSKKIHFIPNGISTVLFLNKEEAQQKLLGENYTGTVIGTIAELHHNKGLEYLIKSFSYLNDENLKCVIIGEGEKRAELENLVRKQSLNTPIIFAGFIENASAYLKAFDIFVLPSLKEGLPYVLLEAGLAELPTISTTVGGIPEIIETGVSGLLVPPKDERTLAAAIELYLRDKSLLHETREKLKEVVEKDFNLEEMLRKTKVLYA